MFHRRRFSGPHKAEAHQGHASLFIMCAMMLFWTLSEGIVSYITPLKIEEHVMSDTMLGVILGTSSVAGALFDFVACRLFPNTYYKRIFGIMFALCLLFPVILMQATTPLFFVLAMIIWGIYYDLRNIGNFDYVARTSEKGKNAAAFGVIQVFQSIGWILGPILVGFLVGESVGWEPFVAIYIFLSIAFIFYLILVFSTKARHLHEHKAGEKVCRRGTWSEIRMMGKVGKVLFPALALIFILNFTDAFFWSIGPLFAEHLGLGHFAGFFMTAWCLPALFLGWFVGKIAAKHGQERLAFITQGLGSLCLVALFFISSGLAVLGVIFVAASFMSVAWPSIQAAFADYIQDRPDLDKEIEGLEDLYTNLGYVFGPITAGFVADAIGYAPTFAFLGIFGVIVAFILVVTSKHINFTRKGPPLICDA